MIDAIAATGDTGCVNCWSGIPFHFGEAARLGGHRATPWRVDIARFASARRWWNLGRLTRGRGARGYQYSPSFLERAEAAIPAPHWAGRVLTFNQHFPRVRSVAERGGRLVHYIDATFASLATTGGMVDNLPARTREEASALERANFTGSEWVVAMARWTADSAVRDCGVPRTRVATILPGANLTLPPGYDFPAEPGRAGWNRPLVLGFVGKDWKRKGLPFLLGVRTELERLGVNAVVRSAGHCPPELARTRGLEYAGFIDKGREPARFGEFLASCDLGCLFSEREPLGISTLEFLHAGVPVTGFMVEGIADTVPPDAGFRFEPGTSAEIVAATLRDAFRDEDRVGRIRAAARAWSPLVTWDRCVAEWRELLTAGRVHRPVQPWLGLPPKTGGLDS